MNCSLESVTFVPLRNDSIKKNRDLFSLSSDYDKSDKATQMFFAETQNKLLYAVTSTAATTFPPRCSPARRGARLARQMMIEKRYRGENQIINGGENVELL
ncbi:MAG: RhuM family protein [Sodaliphilus pleomorphus]|uniref:RhuM family protein n=1 Tax=Sodaliphilus pleomorphus TaxID=2606626 RepID=UPI00240A6F71|nr:RhuM family protein [Sodaliphilus pleomorphus]MDD6474285.1 RhuM family protein [Sodaliphilus pleomorphus]